MWCRFGCWLLPLLWIYLLIFLDVSLLDGNVKIGEVVYFDIP